MNTKQHIEVLNEMKDALRVEVADLMKKYYDTADNRMAQFYGDKARGLEAAIKIIDNQITLTERYVD